LVVADICFISPDLLHHQLYKAKKLDWSAWAQFLRKLSYVVIDEAHTYIGSFGSNFALLMRRLSLSVQVCGGRPSDLRFILATATIANPLSLAQKLTGRDEFRLIEKSGAASHKSYVAVTPNGSIDLIDRLAGALMDGPVSGIIFCNSRNEVKSIQFALSKSLPGKVQAYYGGLNPVNRRNVVEAVRSGATRIIVATSALEAGIDLPDLDFCICYGFPESLMSWRQRIGRAGRSGARLALFVPKPDKPLDRFYQDDPRLLMGEPEKGVVPDSKLFTERHIRCAIAESRPSSVDLQAYFGLDIATAMKMSGARLSGDHLELSGYPHM
jgi:DEAD/DEAH box helicase domain-containing protein